MADRVLITGSTGLLGRHVHQRWDIDGLEAVSVDRHSDDLLKPGCPSSVIRRLRPFAVVHLAWSASGTADYRTSPDNDRWVEASLEMQQACRDIGTWFIGTGTALDEATATGDPYSASKVRLRRALSSSIDAGEITWLRPFYVIDPARRRPALVADAMVAREHGSTLALRTPANLHDFIHGADAGAAIVEVVRHGVRGVVDIGTGHLRRVSELVTALGVPWALDPNPTPPPPHAAAAADAGQLRVLGWAPEYTDQLFASHRPSTG